MHEKPEDKSMHAGKIPLPDADWRHGQRWGKGCSNSREMQVVVENICTRVHCGMTWRKNALAGDGVDGNAQVTQNAHSAERRANTATTRRSYGRQVQLVRKFSIK